MSSLSKAQRSVPTPPTGRPVAIVPAYEPEPAMVPLVRELARADLAGVVVVDDGSGPDFFARFDELAYLENVTVLHHAVNLGKGAALKTALNHAAVAFPDAAGFVTADADGQHRLEDILNVADTLCDHPDELVLGCREFGPDVPFRSKFGNVLTRWSMRLVVGQRISDTQTGLRGIPRRLIPRLLRLRSTGYEFELDMLLTCKAARVAIREVPIETIYIDDNASSHFNPIADSMRIYFVLLRFALVSLATALLDNVVFALVFLAWPRIAVAQVAARAVATVFNLLANKKAVFRSNATYAQVVPRFLALVIVSGAISYGLILTLSQFTPLGVVPSKILAETVVFIFNFAVQRDFVFGQPASSQIESDRD